ncbi:MAG: ABC transporter permease [Lachnospiraceae bacterium]|jgi:ABC-2 type transport system permease protein|nr:ABC transporter permease [Lachnospiraceae bacterium]MEE3461914.1 ABC transporter permease [Lachnospiraceae bacterium]
MRAVYKKELKQYFTSMTGFIFLALFIVLVGLYTWAYNMGSGVGNFEKTLGRIRLLFLFIIPVITMRIMAEERHQKTDQLLLTSPVPVWKIVSGKYFAVDSLFLIGMAEVSTYPIILWCFNHDVRLSTAYSAVIGFFLMGSAYIAMGMFISSLTESQVIAAIVTFLAVILSYLMPSLTQALPADGKNSVLIIAILAALIVVLTYGSMKNIIVSGIFLIAAEAIIWILYAIDPSMYDSLLSVILNTLSISDRFNDFTLGILKISSVIYYLSVIFIFNFLTIQMTERKKYQ